MSRKAIPTFNFSLVVVQLGHRFLVVREAKHGQLWYLPAGRVERGESFPDAARREVREEAGIEVSLTGILRIEHTPMPDHTRMRVIYLARPVDDTPPKSVPDDESLEARWVTLDEASRLQLRGEELMDIFKYVATGPLVIPTDSMVLEGFPWSRRR